MVRDHLTEGTDQRVIAAMAALPRHDFVAPGLRGSAYDDAPLAIGCGQTISQPRVVGRMLTLLGLSPGMNVLDVGGGSGYAAALIARLVAPGHVVAVERQAGLIAQARIALARHAPHVELIHGDGLDAAPTRSFDVIHVACACSEPPVALCARLHDHGVLIAPVGPHDGQQQLMRFSRHGLGEVLDDVWFVPALRGLA